MDPALVERGLRGHAVTQNLLADFVKKIGLEPRSPQANEPNFDLAWENHDATSVAEVKSLSEQNEEKQLRLGLGQVIRYRFLLSRLTGKQVNAVLTVERQPADPSWQGLCQGNGVLLVWPDIFEQLVISERRR